MPPGVFNLVNGTGPEVGNALSTHPAVSLISFTGSLRAGVAIAKAAADTPESGVLRDCQGAHYSRRDDVYRLFSTRVIT